MPPLRHMDTQIQVRDFWRTVFHAVQMVVVLVVSVLAAATLYFSVAVWGQLESTPEISSLESYDRADPIQIFDRYDKLVYTYTESAKPQRVSLSLLPRETILAVLAAEDHKFYEHQGIDLVGTCRALIVNLKAGRVVEGGSTITQQLVKNLFFEQPKRNLERKLAEALISLDVERRYSKDQILEMYLNEAYFGNGAYGIEQAARYYFGKDAAQMNLAEACFLAGLIKSPTRLGARENRQQALAEQADVLAKMHRYGFIGRLQLERAQFTRLDFVEQREVAQAEPIEKYPYYISYVLDLISQRYTPAEMRRQGLRVYTALDPTAQEIGERALVEGIAGAPEGVTQGALATVSVRDGSIVAMVGGVNDYLSHQYNCATHAHMAGSAFKPFVYLAALEKGIVTPESFIEDAPLTVKQAGAENWTPNNFDKSFMGRITVRDALVFSRNIPAVRTAQDVGVPAIIDAARRAGIREALPDNLSVALGSASVSPVDMAGAYATFARDGLYIRPWVLRRIENKKGHLVQKFEQPVSRACDPQAVADLAGMMREVVTRGTGKQAMLPDIFVAGKTGTSDQAKDLWFVGYTPDLATAIWGGNDDNEPIPGTHVTGGTVMAKIWREYTSQLYGNSILTHNGLIRHLIAAPKPAPPPPAPVQARVRAPIAKSPLVSTTRPPARATAPKPAPVKAQAPGLLKPQKARMDYTYTPPPADSRSYRRLQF